jgi:hypothetical protein
VGARVMADEVRLPVGRRAVGILGLQRLGVILAVVAKELPAGIELAAVAYQPVPVIVPDLMPEVTEQGPVGLVPRPTRIS